MRYERGTHYKAEISLYVTSRVEKFHVFTCDSTVNQMWIRFESYANFIFQT